MGYGLEILSGRATAPSTTLTALTMASGNSLTIRNAVLNSDIRLLDLWAFNNAAGIFRVRSPNLHDNVQGIRNRVVASDPSSLLAHGFYQKLIPQDTLIAEISGSAVGGQIEQGQMLIWYNNLPGVASRLANWSDIANRIVNIENAEVAITTGAGGGYTGQVAINSTFDNFKANTDYAIIGGLVDTVCAAVRVQGADTGNLGVGFPGFLGNRNFTARYFKELNLLTGLPCIPIINSANKQSTLVDVVQNQGAAAVNVTITLAQLAPQ